MTYYRIGVNLSPLQFEASDVTATVERLLGTYAVPGSLFGVEILESHAIASWPRMATAVLHLRAMGLRVALDDFGSGYAGLDRLRELPIDLVKVDRSLVGPRPDAQARPC